MNKNNKKGIAPLMIVIAILGVFLLSAVVIAKLQPSKGYNENGQLVEKRTVSCDVTLKKHVFGKEYIANVACDTTNGCSMFNSLGIFTDRGNVRLLDSNKVLDRKEWKFTTIIHETDKLTLSGCTADNDVKIRLTDDEDNLLDERTVRLN